MPDHSPYEDRLNIALRSVGVFASAEQVDALSTAIRQIIHEEVASLGGHLLSTYGMGQDPSTLTSAADPQAEQAAEALGTLGGYLLEHYGQSGPL